MENQHQKIKGYRDLSQDEINLMNEAKELGTQYVTLIEKLTNMRETSLVSETSKLSDEQLVQSLESLEEANRFLRTGQMWLIRAIALPDPSFL